MVKVLNLDKNFKPLRGEEISFKNFLFAGGEVHIKIESELDSNDVVHITHRLNSFNDVGLLCLAVDAIRNMGVKNISAFIPYFPAARQDRLMVKGEPLSVKVYANIINALNLDRVTVFDPHSEVTPALLNNCEVLYNFEFIKKCIEKTGEVLLISPDGGALKKIYKVSEYLNGVEVVECSKSRNVKTGALTGFKVYADDLKGQNCLIVDDICDGGGTFIGLAKELKSKNAGKLFLAVSHGIFSKGFNELREDFDGIFTTDSFRAIDEKIVTQINLNQLL